MQYYFAPLEGVTGSEFRRAHHRWFPGVDAYYMPFLSPTQDHVFTQRELRNVLPEHNQGFRAVPQLLTKNADDFLWCAGELAAMGYDEVNLNLGCPSGTVVAKGKGAGLLGAPEALDRMLDRIFSAPGGGVAENQAGAGGTGGIRPSAGDLWAVPRLPAHHPSPGAEGLLPPSGADGVF